MTYINAQFRSLLNRLGDRSRIWNNNLSFPSSSDDSALIDLNWRANLLHIGVLLIRWIGLMVYQGLYHFSVLHSCAIITTLKSNRKYKLKQLTWHKLL